MLFFEGRIGTGTYSIRRCLLFPLSITPQQIFFFYHCALGNQWAGVPVARLTNKKAKGRDVFSIWRVFTLNTEDKYANILKSFSESQQEMIWYRSACRVFIPHSMSRAEQTAGRLTHNFY